MCFLNTETAEFTEKRERRATLAGWAWPGWGVLEVWQTKDLQRRVFERQLSLDNKYGV